MRFAFLPIVLALLGLNEPAAAGHHEKEPYDPRKAHAEVDANGDGFIDHEEFHARVVAIFFHGDRDKDGMMTVEEVRAVVIYEGELEEADRNGDDLISLHELMRQRFLMYEEVDADKDGMLSMREVVEAVEEGELR